MKVCFDNMRVILTIYRQYIDNILAIYWQYIDNINNINNVNSILMISTIYWRYRQYIDDIDNILTISTIYWRYWKYIDDIENILTISTIFRQYWCKPHSQRLVPVIRCSCSRVWRQDKLQWENCKLCETGRSALGWNNLHRFCASKPAQSGPCSTEHKCASWI